MLISPKHNNRLGIERVNCIRGHRKILIVHCQLGIIRMVQNSDHETLLNIYSLMQSWTVDMPTHAAEELSRRRTYWYLAT